MTTKQTADSTSHPKKAFVLDDFDYSDTATLDVIPPGTADIIATITFAGPGHEKTIDISNTETRKRLLQEAQARVNTRAGTKPDGRTPETVRNENVGRIVNRIVGWSGFLARDADGGGTHEIPFTEAAAMAILADPRKGWLFSLCFDFLFVLDSFTTSSAKN